jgi:hypothetical protein
MTESTKEFNFIEGVDLDEKNLTEEYGDIIEFEIGESVSLLYDKKEKKYFLYGIDYDNSFDEFTFELDDTFDGMTFDGVFVSKEDFQDFKELVAKVA